MKYEITYNPAAKMWCVWKVMTSGSAEIVKRFKTKQGAENWIAKR